MGSFTNIAIAFRKIQVKAIVSIVLSDYAKKELIDIPPQILVDAFTNTIQAGYPELFEGQSFERPHKSTIALFSIVHGTGMLVDGDVNKSTLKILCCSLLKDFIHSVPPTKCDNELVDLMMVIMMNWPAFKDPRTELLKWQGYTAGGIEIE